MARPTLFFAEPRQMTFGVAIALRLGLLATYVFLISVE
jgi:hypothetical protein